MKENVKLKRAISSVLPAKSEKDSAVCLKEGCTNTDIIFQTDAQEVHEGRREEMSYKNAGHHTRNMDSLSSLAWAVTMWQEAVNMMTGIREKTGFNEIVPQLEGKFLLPQQKH